MAEGLAAQGCEVAIWGTNADKNAAALETIKAYGVNASATFATWRMKPMWLLALRRHWRPMDASMAALPMQALGAELKRSMR